MDFSRVATAYAVADAVATLKHLQGAGYEQRWEGILDRLCRSYSNGFFYEDCPHLVNLLVALQGRLSAGECKLGLAVTSFLRCVKHDIFPFQRRTGANTKA